MKKILLIAIMCVFSINVYAACNTPTVVNYDANQEPEDNEFLYPSQGAYDESKNGFSNTNEENSGSGVAYECDWVNPKSCERGEKITLQPGHVFRGNVIPKETTYECTINKWVATEIHGEYCNAVVYGDIAVGDQYKDLLTLAQCSGYHVTDSTNGTKFVLKCLTGRKLECWAAECTEGMQPDDYGVCQKKADDTKDKKSCAQTKCKGLTGDALKECTGCCGVSKEVAKWTNSKCVCTESGMTFVPTANGKSGVCIPERNEDNNQFACPENLQSLIADWTASCPTSVTAQNLMQQLIALCAGSITEQQYYELRLAIANQIYTDCPNVVEIIIDEEDEEDEEEGAVVIISAGSALDEMFAGFDVNVWRDAEGKFNTARLASDSIAAVVLGTAGGLITSSVMKKHQTEDGFEDLQCVVGGQPVAGYGDEFKVGIQ